MHYHNGYLINDNGERTLICSECKRLIGFTDGEMKGYIIRAICSCGGLIKKTKHRVPSANDSLKAAYLSGNDYICPNCGRIMFRITAAIYEILRSLPPVSAARFSAKQRT